MTNAEDASLETRGLKLKRTEAESNLRNGDRKEAKEEDLFGEARVWDNVGFADCREAAMVFRCGQDGSKSSRSVRND